MCGTYRIHSSLWIPERRKKHKADICLGSQNSFNGSPEFRFVRKDTWKDKIYQASITKLTPKRSRKGTFCPQILVAMLPGLRDYFCNIPMSESPREMTAKEKDSIKQGDSRTSLQVPQSKRKLGKGAFHLSLTRDPECMEAKDKAQS